VLSCGPIIPALATGDGGTKRYILHKNKYSMIFGHLFEARCCANAATLTAIGGLWGKLSKI
jgi:hypothetical protein